MKEQELQTQALSLKEKALTVEVSDPGSYKTAIEMLKPVRALKKQIVDFFKPIKQSFDEGKKKVLDKEKETLAPVNEVDELLTSSINVYLTAEEKKRQEAEAEAIRKAEAEAEKEREKLLQRAANAKTEEKQEELLDKAEAVYAAPVQVDHAVDKTVSGVTRKMDVAVTVRDNKAFLMAMLDNHYHALVGMLEIKQGPLKTFIKTNGYKTFPGLIVEEKAGISVRA